MSKQLVLIPAKTDWRLPEKVKSAGRRGIIAARKALADNKPEEVKL